MNKTQIEWVKNPDGTQGYTWNPITGCLNNVNGLCKGGGFPCYAYKLAHGRLKPLYLNNLNVGECPDREIEILAQDQHPFYPRFWEERLEKHRLYSTDNGKGIFVCDMGDLFGIGVPVEWTRKVMDYIRTEFDDRFYLLTKQPQNLIKFTPFPDNCFVGVTVTNESMMQPAYEALDCIQAKVKYISFEPLLSRLSGANIKLIASAEYYKWLDWLIIGACTGTYREMEQLAGQTRLERDYQRIKPLSKKLWTYQPKIEWVREIVEAADKAGVKVFLKDNLEPLLIPEDCSKPNYLTEDIFWASEKAQLRQEMPGDMTAKMEVT